MTKEKRTRRIAALAVTACIPTAIAIFCAAAFDSRSEYGLALLLYIAVAFLAQIALQPVIGVLSPSFGSAVAISVLTCLSFAAALTVFCLRANFLVIRRLPSGYLYGLH